MFVKMLHRDAMQAEDQGSLFYIKIRERVHKNHRFCFPFLFFWNGLEKETRRLAENGERKNSVDELAESKTRLALIQGWDLGQGLQYNSFLCRENEKLLALLTFWSVSTICLF